MTLMIIALTQAVALVAITLPFVFARLVLYTLLRLLFPQDRFSNFTLSYFVHLVSATQGCYMIIMYMNFEANLSKNLFSNFRYFLETYLDEHSQYWRLFVLCAFTLLLYIPSRGKRFWRGLSDGIPAYEIEQTNIHSDLICTIPAFILYGVYGPTITVTNLCCIVLFVVLQFFNFTYNTDIVTNQLVWVANREVAALANLEQNPPDSHILTNETMFQVLVNRIQLDAVSKLKLFSNLREVPYNNPYPSVFPPRKSVLVNQRTGAEIVVIQDATSVTLIQTKQPRRSVYQPWPTETAPDRPSMKRMVLPTTNPYESGRWSGDKGKTPKQVMLEGELRKAPAARKTRAKSPSRLIAEM